MPISSPLCLSPVSQKEFAQIDYQVIRHAFEMKGAGQKNGDRKIAGRSVNAYGAGALG
jgi:hypothetical protein